MTAKIDDAGIHAYTRDYCEEGQTRPIMVFFLNSLRTDNHTHAYPSEPFGKVMQRMYPDGIPCDQRIMIDAAPEPPTDDDDSLP